MLEFLSRLRLALAYGPELEAMLEQMREAEIERVRLEKQDQLRLCKKHQPRSPGSHYSEHNCDHCKLIKQRVEEELTGKKSGDSIRAHARGAKSRLPEA